MAFGAELRERYPNHTATRDYWEAIEANQTNGREKREIWVLRGFWTPNRGQT
jgi:hypothetical protein